MDEIKQYSIIYSESAEDDIVSKAEYIANVFRDSYLAYKWYCSLRAEIKNDLSFFPYKYPIYDVSPWREQGIREFIMKNDIVLYSADEEHLTIYIHGVFTHGENLIEKQSETDSNLKPYSQRAKEVV